MKANVILGKKQIVIAALVLILGAAVYLNWQDARSDVPAELESTAAVAAQVEDVPVQADAILDEILKRRGL